MTFAFLKIVAWPMVCNHSLFGMFGGDSSPAVNQGSLYAIHMYSPSVNFIQHLFFWRALADMNVPDIRACSSLFSSMEQIVLSRA